MHSSDIVRLLRAIDSPRFHGNGFTQLYIGENMRLHVWDPDLPPIPGHNAAIHDHVYDMRSRVWAGVLTQVTYEVAGDRERATAEMAMDVYELSVKATPGTPASFEHIARQAIRETGRLEIGEGCLYTQARNTLHESVGPRAVTLFERLPREDDRNCPRIVCPCGEQPMNAFAREYQPSTEMMWLVIEQAVRSLSLTGRLSLSAALSAETSATPPAPAG